MTLFSRERKDPPIVKTEEEIELIRASCKLVSRTLGELKKHIRPGITTLELDRIAEDFVLSNGGHPAFKDYKQSEDDSPFPGTICASVNHTVVHGVPKEEDVLLDGDIVTLDMGVYLNGYYGDSAYTFTVGEVKPEVLRLLHVTKESLYLGIAEAVTGKRIGDISYAVQNHVLKHGYSVVKELVGHGIGANLHEPPEVPNYGKRGNGTKLQANWVIAIEPMINMGKPAVVKHAQDGWSILAEDRKPSAHFEHTVVIRKGKADILTTFDFIEN